MCYTCNEVVNCKYTLKKLKKKIEASQILKSLAPVERARKTD